MPLSHPKNSSIRPCTANWIKPTARVSDGTLTLGIGSRIEDRAACCPKGTPRGAAGTSRLRAWGRREGSSQISSTKVLVSYSSTGDLCNDVGERMSTILGDEGRATRCFHGFLRHWVFIGRYPDHMDRGKDSLNTSRRFHAPETAASSHP